MRRIVVMGLLLAAAFLTGCGAGSETPPEGKTERVGRLPKPAGVPNPKGGETSK